MVDAQSSQGASYSQFAPQITETSLKLRLDTVNLLMQIETDLRGEIIQVIESDGQFKTIRSPVGERKLNDKGVQDVMKFLKSCINPSSTQGNLEKKDYELFLFSKRLELTKMLFINLPKYDMHEDDLGGIINDCMNLLELVVSRTIDNKERESYQQTIRHTESQTIEGKKGILPF
jgi:hypothetical protein